MQNTVLSGPDTGRRGQHGEASVPVGERHGRQEEAAAPLEEMRGGIKSAAGPALAAELEKVDAYLAEYLADPGFGGAAGKILADMGRSRGKLLRPRLLLMAGQCGPGFARARDRLCRLGALVELVHMASLIHDDIVDDAPLRRGMPTVQSRYGKDMAVYAGDLLLSRIVQSLFRDGFARVGACFGDTVEAMCLGELGQMECRYREDTTAERYLQNIYGKTAALCRLACMAGAAESGCSEAVQATLEDLGANFGYMFQIRDDLLDFTSDAAREGKATQADFREGILTLPVLYALQDPDARPAILQLLQAARSGRFGEAEAGRLCSLVQASGGISRAREDMNMYAARALRAVAALPENGASAHFRALLRGLT